MSYSAEVLTDSPLAYYRLGDASATMLDSSGNAHNGLWTTTSVLGAPGLIPGDADTAANFSSNAWGEVTSPTWLNGNALTVECWFKTSTLTEVMVTRQIGGAAVGWTLIGTAGRIRFFTIINGSSTTVDLTTPAGTTYDDNQPHHCVVTYDETTLRIYVDGAEVASKVAPDNIPSSTDALRIGGTSTGVNHRFTGVLDEVALWTTALSPARIAAHFAAAAPSTSVAIGHATETTTAHALTLPSVPLELGHAAEATTVYALATAVPVPLGVATETTTAHPLGGVGAVIELGHATETTTVHAITFDAGYVDTTRNRTSGRGDRAQPASVDWEPAVAPIPASLSAAVAYDTALAFSVPVMTLGRPVVEVATATRRHDRHRILIGNVDVTFFRGVPTPELDYQLIQPLLYGPASLVLPQVFAAFETPGEGDLSWLKPGARVRQQAVDADGNVRGVVYKGRIIAFDVSGAELRVEIGGEASGPAALQQQQVPLFRQVRDIGRMLFDQVTRAGVRFAPRLGPETGIRLAASGGVNRLDYINQLCAQAVTKTGEQWTVMPDSEGVYRMALKDTTTIHATVYPHDGQLPADLRRDLAEEPNRIYGTGVTPDGMRVLGGVYPGLRQGDPVPYPFTDGRAFGEGTTNADTDTGSGITAMIHQLGVHGYIRREDLIGGYDADVTSAIEALQDDAGLPVTGIMTEKTWAALYDIDATGFSTRWSRIEPMAQRSYTRLWRLTASGAVISRNPNFDRHRLKVDRNVDFGVGFERRQMRQWARAELDHGEDNWVGTVALETGAVITGAHTPGDPIAEADVMPATSIKPGMNLSLPLFMGGITVHVSAVSVSGGRVTVTVDTRARDTLQVWEVIRRNRESRRNPHRAWVRDHLSSGMTKDAITEWSEVGGVLGSDVTLEANTWRVFEVPVGRAGTVQRLRLNTNPNAEFCVAVFGARISAKKLAARIGNPLTVEGRTKWDDQSMLDDLDLNHLLLYTAGDHDQPCGYFPRKKTGDDGEPTGADLTGKWQDDAGVGYDVGAANVLRVAVYADRDTVIPAGRIMWPQLEPGS